MSDTQLAIHVSSDDRLILRLPKDAFDRLPDEAVGAFVRELLSTLPPTKLARHGGFHVSIVMGE